MSHPKTPSSFSWLTLSLFAWLFLLSVLVGISLVSFRGFAVEFRRNAESKRIEALDVRIEAIIKQNVEQLNASRIELADVRSALEARLLRVEETAARKHEEWASAQQTQSQRIDTLQADLNATKRPHEAAAPAAAPKTQPLPQPPFEVIGIEVRHGERLLSILSRDARSANDIRLMREGEQIGEWTLHALEGKQALFRVAGQIRRLPMKGMAQ
jgi:hypothetical protein